MEFKVLSSEHLFKGKVYDLWREKVQYPDGRVSGIEFVQMIGSVTILPIDDQGKIWFVRQYRHPAGKKLLELPAGCLEEGENPAVCAAREIREEIRMAAGELKKLGEFYLAPGYSNECTHVFLASNLSVDPLEQDTGELIWVERHTIEQVWDMVKEGEIIDAKTLAALLIAREHLPG
jgi:ADP-ribose pyrophosphatase